MALFCFYTCHVKNQWLKHNGERIYHQGFDFKSNVLRKRGMIEIYDKRKYEKRNLFYRERLDMKEIKQWLITGDSAKVLPELIKRNENGTYHLCITSPPYWRLVEYNAGCGDLSMLKSEDEFSDKLEFIFKYVSRLLVRDGTLVVQWEDQTIKRPDGRVGEYMLSSINWAAENAGMILYARYVWKKYTKKPSVMYSTYDMAQSRLGRPNPSWSYAFVYKQDVDTKMCSSRSEITRDEWNTWGSDAVWEFQNPGVEHHNTPFAPEFVERMLKLYTAQGDKVLEPFLGSGTTMKVCAELGRSCTGIELNANYVDKIKKYVGWGQQSIGFRQKYVYEVFV